MRNLVMGGTHMPIGAELVAGEVGLYKLVGGKEDTAEGIVEAAHGVVAEHEDIGMHWQDHDTAGKAEHD